MHVSGTQGKTHIPCNHHILHVKPIQSSLPNTYEEIKKTLRGQSGKLPTKRRKKTSIYSRRTPATRTTTLLMPTPNLLAAPSKRGAVYEGTAAPVEPAAPLVLLAIPLGTCAAVL